MPLTEIEDFFGGAEIRETLPPIHEYNNVVYVPFSQDIFFDRDPNWGIYDEDGALIRAAAYLRGTEPRLIGQSWQAVQDVRKIERAPEGDYLYAGPLIPHYGHFVLTSLARLWPFVLTRRPGTKILFHAQGTPEGWFGTPYIRHMLRGLGLTPDDCVTFPHPVKLSALTVPGLSFGEEAFAYRVFAETCHLIGRSMLKDEIIATSDRRPIYFSKSRLNTGVGRLQNEVDLVTALAKKIDFEVIYPEELSLPSQVALIASGRMIMGTISSAFHTSLFCENKPTLLGVSYRNKIPSNFKMVDVINGNRATYVWPTEGFPPGDDNGNFLETFKAVDPAGLAGEIANLVTIRQKRGDMSDQTLDNHHLVVPDHQGISYKAVLGFMHETLAPKSYLETGTLRGDTLALAKCAAIAIDPQFQINSNVVGSKPVCSLFQMKSDAFFDEHDPHKIFGRPIDMAFLDGMHRCEFLLRDFLNTEHYCRRNSVIILHDCLPVELPMAERDQGYTAIMPHRQGWWTGDVWRTVRALKKYRPDLSISAFNAAPTGLVIITNLDPSSTVLTDRYAEITAEMLGMSLETIGIANYFEEISTESTDAIMSGEKLTARYWL